MQARSDPALERKNVRHVFWSIMIGNLYPFHEPVRWQARTQYMNINCCDWTDIGDFITKIKRIYCASFEVISPLTIQVKVM